MLPSESGRFWAARDPKLACKMLSVLASDLPVFREVGGEGILYAPLLNLPAWCDMAATGLPAPCCGPYLVPCLCPGSQASRHEHARIIVDSYRRLVG